MCYTRLQWTEFAKIITIFVGYLIVEIATVIKCNMAQVIAYLVCMLFLICGWNIHISNGIVISPQMCQFIQKLIRRFEEDKGKRKCNIAMH